MSREKAPPRPEGEKIFVLTSSPLTELVRHYIGKKELARAEALLSQLADAEQYPFGASADLLLALGSEQSADRGKLVRMTSASSSNGPGFMCQRHSSSKQLIKCWSRLSLRSRIHAFPSCLRRAVLL